MDKFLLSVYHHNGQNKAIDGSYVNDLVINYGNPSWHIWTYTVGGCDNCSHVFKCPCAIGGRLFSPPFVDADYYCESGAISTRKF